MANYYKATSTKDPDRFLTSGVILSKDSQGNPDKEVVVGGEAVELNDEEVKSVKKYLNVSKVEDDKVESVNEKAATHSVDEVVAQQPTATIEGATPQVQRKGR